MRMLKGENTLVKLYVPEILLETCRDIWMAKKQQKFDVSVVYIWGLVLSQYILLLLTLSSVREIKSANPSTGGGQA